MDADTDQRGEDISSPRATTGAEAPTRTRRSFCGPPIQAARKLYVTHIPISERT
jgi:hypothetical protein